MIIALAAAVGAFVTFAGLKIAPVVLDKPKHIRQNFRGNPILATAGLILMKVVVWAWAVSFLAEDGRTLALAMAASGVVMALLGYIDDVYGDRRAGGLVGHARALLKGNFTTGMLKAIGGAVVGLAAAWAIGWEGQWIVVAGAVIALASNLANLFDLRPARVGKLWLPLAGWLAVVVHRDAPRAVLAGLGAGVVLFALAELREQVMLGDTGAGLLGVVLGVGLASVVDETGLVIALVVLLALTLSSEVVSFSRVIEAVPPLRWYDRLGRRP